MIRHVAGRLLTASRKLRDPGREQLAGLVIAGVLRHHLRELLERDPLLAFDHGVEQAVEIREVVVDDRPGDAGLAGDRLDRDAGVSALEDHLECGVNQMLTALLGRHPRRVPAPALGGREGLRGHRAVRLADRPAGPAQLTPAGGASVPCLR